MIVFIYKWLKKAVFCRCPFNTWRNSYDEAYTLYDTALFLLNMNARNTANVSRPGCWVRKHVFLRHLITPPNVCQDRLGTNITRKS